MKTLRTAICLTGWLFAGLAPGQAQQQPAKPATTPARPAEPAKCARYESATRAAYGAYVGLVRQDVPEIGENGANQADIADKLQELYEKLVDEAQNDDPIALRKAAALEIFGMQAQGRPILDVTRKKVCTLAKMPDSPAKMLDSLTCSVILSDETRRKDATNRDSARAMLATAKAQLPARASLTDTSRMVYDEVARGLEGCF